MRDGSLGRFDVESLVGTAQQESLPVIICLWKRRERLLAILQQLDAQTDGRPLRVMLWNNNAEDDTLYRSMLGSVELDGAVRSIEYVSSAVNVGGIGRFFLARTVLQTGYTGHIVTLDDDQDVSPTFIGDLLAAARPREIAGWWAWNYLDSHWRRTPTEPGELADYVGTGGAIIDIDIVRSRSFFTRLPLRFLFLEDQWMCAYARGLDWNLRKVDTQIDFVLHETNQFLLMAKLKDEFRTYLLGGN
ncbi:glycosyltransferase family 2 protein [Glaciibacter flavus]|uniref:glycosyltransferase family 2 protein n=1 Tax=Orlajensenia flava TaxID=2565934 RepID=UPI003AFFD6C4